MPLMSDTKSTWESFKAEGANAAEKLKEVLAEGNVRRVVVEHEGRTIAEFPLAIGVVGVVLAPVFAGVAALAALIKDCTIKIEREPGAPAKPPASFGHGFISVLLSAILGIAGFGAVLCLHFPEYLTHADLRAMYSLGYRRAAADRRRAIEAAKASPSPNLETDGL